MSPEMVLKPKPCSASLTFNQSMVLLNWLKTRALAVGSAALMSSSCMAGKASGRQSDEQWDRLLAGGAVAQALYDQNCVLTGPATVLSSSSSMSRGGHEHQDAALSSGLCQVLITCRSRL